MSDVNLFDY